MTVELQSHVKEMYIPEIDCILDIQEKQGVLINYYSFFDKPNIQLSLHSLPSYLLQHREKTTLNSIKS